MSNLKEGRFRSREADDLEAMRRFAKDRSRDDVDVNLPSVANRFSKEADDDKRAFKHRELKYELRNEVKEPQFNGTGISKDNNHKELFRKFIQRKKDQMKAKREMTRAEVYDAWVNRGGDFVFESDDLGPEQHKEKTVKLKHKTSGKEIVVTKQAAPHYAKIGYKQCKEETIPEGTGYKVSGAKIGPKHELSWKDERELVKKGILPGGDENKHYEKQMGRAGKVSTRQAKAIEKGKFPKGPNERAYSNHLHSEETQIDELDMSKKAYVHAVYTLSDPEYEGPLSTDKAISKARKAHGDKFANDLEQGTDKMHYPRHPRVRGAGPDGIAYDSLAWRKPTRVTAKGKANKIDVQARKNSMKSDRAIGVGFGSPRGKLPEEVINEDQFDAKERAQLVHSLHTKLGHRVSELEHDRRTGTASFTVIDGEGTQRRHIFTPQGKRIENMGQIASDVPAKRGRGRPKKDRYS